MEYEKVFAVEAEKRRIASLSGKFSRQEDVDYHASDEAGDLFKVSGRSVRDAKFVAEHDPEAFEKIKTGDTRCT